MGASEGVEALLIGAVRPSEHVAVLLIGVGRPSERVGVLLIDEVRASESSEAGREGAGLCL